jgi:TrmH family RNA methyltransferase
MTITSKTNRHLSEIRRLAGAGARSRSGRFVVEGEDLVMAADAAGVSAHYVLCAQGCADACRPGYLEVDPPLLASVCALRQGSRVVGVFEQRWDERASGPLAVALWGVRDPGNVGTVIRAAQAFGASSVALGPRCADPYAPKAVRASMGAIFGTPLARFASIADLRGRVVALATGAERALRGPLAAEVTLLVGSERDGLPGDVLAACDEVCSIRQVAGDSLNAAMAATVALYEATRMADR